MKKPLVSAAILIVSFIIDGSESLVLAQQVGIKLFDATPVFGTGPQTSPAEAIPFASTSLILGFAPGDTAVISSTSDGTGPIVIDNFVTINGVNACEGVTGQQFPESCFGPTVKPELPTGVPVETVFTPIPPVDVSTFIPVGTSAVHFELRDFGVIAGNTDLFLVTTAKPMSQPAVGQALDTIRRALQRVENQMEQVGEVAQATRGRVEAIDQNVTATRGRVEVIDQNVTATRGRVEAIDQNVQETEAVARRVLTAVSEQ